MPKVTSADEMGAMSRQWVPGDRVMVSGVPVVLTDESESPLCGLFCMAACRHVTPGA